MSFNTGRVGYRHKTKDEVVEELNEEYGKVTVDNFSIGVGVIALLTAPHLVIKRVDASGEWYCKVCNQSAVNELTARKCCERNQ